MACKYCNGIADSYSFEGGWPVCSERCRVGISQSIANGRTSVAPGTLTLGALKRIILFFLLAFVIGFITYVFSDGKTATNTNYDATSERNTEQSVEQEGGAEEENSDSDEPSTTADELVAGISTSSEDELAMGTSPSDESAVSPEANESVASSEMDGSDSSDKMSDNGVSATQRAEQMLLSTSPRYSTKDIMNMTGLSRKQIKHLRNNL